MQLSLNNQLVRFVVTGSLLYIGWLLLYEFYLHPHTGFDAVIIRSLVVSTEVVLQTAGYSLSDYNNIPHAAQQHVGIEGSGGLTVGAPCDGVVLYVLFICFIAAFPGPLKHKAWYLPLGTLSVFAVNVLRIASLAVIVYVNPEWLAFNHDYTFTLLVYSYVFALWMLWVKKFSTLGERVNAG
ncbi:MAG: exosortase X [Flavobacteriales bacterium]|jgi:exosortase family protein XrtF